MFPCVLVPCAWVKDRSSKLPPPFSIIKFIHPGSCTAYVSSLLSRWRYQNHVCGSLFDPSAFLRRTCAPPSAPATSPSHCQTGLLDVPDPTQPLHLTGSFVLFFHKHTHHIWPSPAALFQARATTILHLPSNPTTIQGYGTRQWTLQALGHPEPSPK